MFINSGFSLQDSLKMLIDKRNQPMIKNIIARQEQGVSIEESINPYITNKIRNYLVNFCKLLSFSKAIEVSVNLHYHQKKMKNQLLQPLIYPLWLLVASIVALLYFYFVGIDQMAQLVYSLYEDQNTLMMMKNILGSMILVLAIASTIFIFCLCAIRHKQNKVLLYIVLSKYFPIPILNKWFTYHYILYYKHCVSAGLKSKETLDLLSTFDDVMVVFLSYHTRILLEQGEEFEVALSNCYLDEKLRRFIHLATVSHQLETMLGTYLQQLETYFMVFFKRLAKLFQVFSYGLIGSIMIISYQILLLPIQMIERL
ncbi:MAG: hypothetical protein R3Y57_01530 [Erysipelotrichaceae bacterium]